MSAAEKAINLAEDCESNHQLATAYRLISEIYQKSCNHKKDPSIAIQFIRRHIDLFEYEQNEEKKFESMKNLLEFEVVNGASGQRVESILKIIMGYRLEVGYR